MYSCINLAINSVIGIFEFPALTNVLLSKYSRKLISLSRDTTKSPTYPPLGPIPGMRWCPESKRYFSSAADSVSLDSFISGSEVNSVYSLATESVRKTPVTEQFLRTLPQKTRKRNRAGSDDCSICLRSGINGKDDPRMRFITLQCRHSFHFYCAAQWLTKRSGSCPVCRSAVDTSLYVAASSFS